MKFQCPYCDSDDGEFLCDENDHSICNGELLVAHCPKCDENFSIVFGIQERPLGF